MLSVSFTALSVRFTTSLSVMSIEYSVKNVFNFPKKTTARFKIVLFQFLIVICNTISIFGFADNWICVLFFIRYFFKISKDDLSS